MLQTSLFPLRTILGDAIPLGKTPKISQTFESQESKQLQIEYEVVAKPGITATITDPHYRNYLPVYDIGGTSLVPGAGMDTLPVPPAPLPFGPDAQVLSLFALSKTTATTDVSRKLSAKFSILLPDKFLVGGICFGGYPYLPFSRSRMQDEGENSANFGLPREVRLTCLGLTGDEKDSSAAFEFLDAEISATKQDIISHSSFHYLCIDPTLTNVVTVHLSDYPRILRRMKSSGDNIAIEERYGFIIPYFYVFQYREKTRYRPPVCAGLLGAGRTGRLKPSRHPSVENAFSTDIEDKYILTDSSGSNGEYFDFTAASMFGQQRDYLPKREFLDREHPQTRLTECFVSSMIASGESVLLCTEQAEEYERSVAGIKIFLPFVPESISAEDIVRVLENLATFFPGFSFDENAPREELEKALRLFLSVPLDVDFCEKIGIRIFELDPLEGVSPVSVPLDGKHATLLADVQIDDLSELLLSLTLDGVKFLRPSNSRYFAIELSNRDDKAGQFAVKACKCIQSAHVSVHPRAAVTQQVKSLNFRLVGSNLAEDYSLLGDNGFNFSIERFIAGERKSVLFRANSLVDLLQVGVAKIYSNVRRRAVEFEQSSYNDAISADKALGAGRRNYDIRRMEAYSDSWRRTETGTTAGHQDFISGPERWYGPLPHWSGQQAPDAPSEQGSAFGFSTLGNREIRTHSANQYPRLTDTQGNSNEWNAIRSYLNLLGEIQNIGQPGVLVPAPPAAGLGVGGWNTRAWLGRSSVPIVSGTMNVSVNPLAPIVDVTNMIDDVINNRPFNAINLGFLATGTVPLLLSGGGNSSLSVSPGGVGVSLGIQPTPTVNYSYSVGSVGNRSTLASEEGYSYAQSLNKSFDDARTVSYGDEGNQNRVVMRKAVPGTDRQRINGAEVMWQGELADIITGSIPLNFTLPATSTRTHFRTADDSLRVRLGSGVGKSVSVDFWFDLTEERVRDDY
ncbi:hypothetical protein [Noviherbaspirillum massiliense]|uniref:hypothetical protein n=1 Tax=Noviherbaspirillum massiliense TaxID=1465823 RepID=UPI0003143C2E|nr:hypothetical protein [Noviherbaspirillum massiliense]